MHNYSTLALIERFAVSTHVIDFFLSLAERLFSQDENSRCLCSNKSEQSLSNVFERLIFNRCRRGRKTNKQRLAIN